MNVGHRWTLLHEEYVASFHLALERNRSCALLGHGLGALDVKTNRLQSPQATYRRKYKRNLPSKSQGSSMLTVYIVRHGQTDQYMFVLTSNGRTSS